MQRHLSEPRSAPPCAAHAGAAPVLVELQPALFNEAVRGVARGAVDVVVDCRVGEAELLGGGLAFLDRLDAVAGGAGLAHEEVCT